MHGFGEAIAAVAERAVTAIQQQEVFRKLHRDKNIQITIAVDIAHFGIHGTEPGRLGWEGSFTDVVV